MKVKQYLKELYEDKYGKEINKELAEAMVYSMEVTDGSDRENGEKWTCQESKEAGRKAGVDFEEVNPVHFYIVLNMMYSDHYRTAKKYGLSDSFYADLAYDWFYDKDGDEHKTYNYFMES